LVTKSVTIAPTSEGRNPAPDTTLADVVEIAQDAYMAARQIAADRRVAGPQR